MQVPFGKTLAYLDREERTTVGRRLLLGAFVAALWGAWLGFSKTTVYAVSEEGRLLAAGAASPVQPSVPGVVVENNLKLGAFVHVGEVLLQLDTAAEKLRRNEEQVKLDSLDIGIESLAAIIDAENGLALAVVRSGNSRSVAAATRAKVASDVASLTKQQNDAMKRLKEASLASGMEVLKEAEAMQRQRGEVSINSAEASNAAADADKARKEVAVRLLNLQRELGDLKGKKAASSAILAQLDWEISRRTLRASIDGTIADMQSLPNGAGLVANQVVATIVPYAKMKWVAYFSPREAVGRIHEGQRARIRMDAFPWTAYGALYGRVVSVGSEPREQRIRAEFEVLQENSQIPLSHGMSGTTEVEVESLSPIRLLLRLSGQVAGGTRGPAAKDTPATKSSTTP
jgi:hemolysin D